MTLEPRTEDRSLVPVTDCYSTADLLQQYLETGKVAWLSTRLFIATVTLAIAITPASSGCAVVTCRPWPHLPYRRVDIHDSCTEVKEGSLGNSLLNQVKLLGLILITTPHIYYNHRFRKSLILRQAQHSPKKWQQFLQGQRG